MGGQAVIEAVTDPLKDKRNRCRDFDEDCPEVRCKVSCWIYMPEEGYCPYLTGELT